MTSGREAEGSEIERRIADGLGAERVDARGEVPVGAERLDQRHRRRDVVQHVRRDGLRRLGRAGSPLARAGS